MLSGFFFIGANPLTVLTFFVKDASQKNALDIS